jgi:hypothetical protein
MCVGVGGSASLNTMNHFSTTHRSRCVYVRLNHESLVMGSFAHGPFMLPSSTCKAQAHACTLWISHPFCRTRFQSPNGPTLVALAHAETTKTSCSGVATGHCNRNDPTAAGDKTKCRQRSKPAEEANGTAIPVAPFPGVSACGCGCHRAATASRRSLRLDSTVCPDSG